MNLLNYLVEGILYYLIMKCDIYSQNWTDFRKLVSDIKRVSSELHMIVYYENNIGLHRLF